MDYLGNPPEVGTNLSGGGGDVVGGTTVTEDVFLDYTVDDANWKVGIDYSESGRPFKIARTDFGPAGDTITCNSDQSVGLTHVKYTGNNIGLTSLATPDWGTAEYNIAIGDTALELKPADSGNGNIAIGTACMRNITTGYVNTVIGSDAGTSMSVTVGGTGVGYECQPTGNNSTAIGTQSSASGVNSMALGTGASVTTDNTVVVGNAAVTSTLPGGDAIQDLGSGSKKFKDLHMSGTANVGGVTATGNVSGGTLSCDTTLQTNSGAFPASSVDGTLINVLDTLYFNKGGQWQEVVLSETGPPPYQCIVSIRKVIPTYTGSCMLVRRSSDDTTQNIGFDTNGYLDKSAFDTFVAGGNGFVQTFYDQSTNGNNFTETVLAEQPQVVFTGGIPEIYFDGTTCIESVNTTATMNMTSGNFYITQKLRTTSSGADRFPVSAGDNPVGTFAYYLPASSTSEFKIFDGTGHIFTKEASQAAWNDGNNHTITMFHGNGDTLGMIYDGVELGTSTAFAIHDDDVNLHVGCRWGSTQGFIGYVSEIIIAGTVVTDEFFKAKSYTVAGLPTATGVPSGAIAYCSNETGGATLVFCDGTNWRRTTDLSVAA